LACVATWEFCRLFDARPSKFRPFLGGLSQSEHPPRFPPVSCPSFFPGRSNRPSPYFRGSTNTILFTKRVCLHEASRKNCRSSFLALEPSSWPLRWRPPLSTMKASSQRPKEREADLNTAIKALDLTKTSSILLAKAVFNSVTTLLTTIRVCSCSSATIYSKFMPSQDSMINNPDCVDLGLSCAHVCRTLDRGTDGRKQDELSPSVYDAMGQLSL